MTKNYFTFFLCARDWGRVEETVFPAIEKLLKVVAPSGKMQATAQLKSRAAGSLPQTLSGSYRRLLRELQPDELTQLILLAEGKTPGVHEFSLYFESARYEHAPEYLRFIYARTPERIEAAGALKVFSFSIRLDLFQRRLGDAERLALRAVVERLFIDARAVYGFGHPTAWPVASPYQFVRDNSPQAGWRVADFDYASRIEDVYVCNYLSDSHLREITALDALCRETAMECRRLSDDLRLTHAMAVYLKDASAETLNVAARYLLPLIPTARPPRKSFHLLLRDSLSDADVEKAPGTYFFAKQVTELPDFIRVTLREPVNADEGQKYTAALNDFFEQRHHGLLRGVQSAAQLIVQYSGLFDPNQIFQRIPGRGFAPSRSVVEYVKLHLTADVRLDRLRLLFLVNASITDEPVERIGEVVRQWLSALSGHAEFYGEVDVVEAFSLLTIADRVHAEIVVEATRLKQDGLNLLVLMLDDLNRDECVVPYLVCGDVPPR